MTLSINTLDNGTNGSPVTTSSIASSGSGLPFQKQGATAAAFTAVNAIDGALSAQFVRTSGSSCYFQTGDALNTLDVSFSFLLDYTGSLPGTNDYVWDARVGTAGSTTSIARCIVNSSNQPFIQLSGSTLGTSTTALIAGNTYRVDGRIHINGSAGSIHCAFYTPYTNATPAFTEFAFTSKNTGTSTIKDVRLGASGSNTVSAGTTVYDLPRIDDTQSATYLGSPTAAAPTCTAGSPQSVNARDSVALAGSVTWAVGHSGTVAWTGGTTPITNATALSATVADIGSPSLSAGNPIIDDTVTYTLTATQDDAQVVTSTVVVTRKCNNRWLLKGTRFVCAPLVRNR